MAERLVDVLDSSGAVIHTYPVTLDESAEAADETAYKSKALEAAAHGRLVPDSELGTWTARMHVSRGGQMALYGDNLAGNSKPRRVWSRPCVNVHIFCGKKMESPRAVQTSIGVEPLTTTCASARTCFGSRRVAPREEPMNTGAGSATSRLSDSNQAASGARYNHPDWNSLSAWLRLRHPQHHDPLRCLSFC